MSVGELSDSSRTRPQVLERQPPPRRSLSSRVSLLHVIAVASGVLAFILILSWMRGQQELVEVAVATGEIRAGNVVAEDGFSFVEIPADSAFGDHLISPDDSAALVGSVATRAIGEGEPILDSDFRPIETPAGLRAMSLPLDVNRAVGGALAIGDRVDIIGFDGGGARYVATDVAVLGIPGESSSAFGAGATFAVTVAVDDLQALALAQALDFAELHVVRSTGAPDVTLDRLAPADDDDPAPEDSQEGGG
jgi:Flp pilus assembly protein CpaB